MKPALFGRRPKAPEPIMSPVKFKLNDWLFIAAIMLGSVAVSLWVGWAIS